MASKHCKGHSVWLSKCCSGKQALSPTFHTGPESLVSAALCIDMGQEHILAAYGCKDLTNLIVQAQAAHQPHPKAKQHPMHSCPPV